MSRLLPSLSLLAVAALGACTVAPPSAPTVMALPAQGKSFEAFQVDDMQCRDYAFHQAGGYASSQAASNSAVGSAVVGTAIGAGLGAALGSVGGAAGAGAAIGGAAGLLAGTSAGANQARGIAGNAQQRYDTGYTQCMYSRGNTVQSAPAAYAAYPGGVYSSGYYPSGYYPAAGYYGPGYYGPSVTIGGGWGWGHRHWYR